MLYTTSHSRLFGGASVAEKVEAPPPRSSLSHFIDRRQLSDEAADVFRASDLWYAIEDCSRNAERFSAVEDSIDARAGDGGIAGMSLGGDRTVVFSKADAPVALRSDALLDRVRREQAEEFEHADRYSASCALSIGSRTNVAPRTFGALHGRGTERPRAPAAVALGRDPAAPPIGTLERAMYIVRSDEAAVRAMVALDSGDTPLHYAVRVGAPPALVALLMEIDADASATRLNKVERNTPLHIAAHTLSAISTLEVLLRSDCSRRAAQLVNRDGDTALHLAARALAQGGVRRDQSGAARRVVVEWVGALVAAHPGAMRVKNKAKQLPLTVAAQNNAPRWVAELFSSFFAR